MSKAKRIAVLYSDGSFGVDKAGVDMTEARRRFMISKDDPDTELVEVEIRVTQRFGPRAVEAAKATDVKCPCCGEEFEP